MNILVAHEFFSLVYYGAERWITEVYKRVAKKHNVYILSCSEDNKIHKEKINNIQIIKVPGIFISPKLLIKKFDGWNFSIYALLQPLTIPKEIKLCVDFIKRYDIDIFHTHLPTGFGWIASLVKKITKKPYIQICHEAYPIDKIQKATLLPYLTVFGKLISRKASHIIIVNKEFFELFEKCGIKRNRVTYVLNSVDTDFFSPNVKPLKLDLERPIVTFIGRLNKEKGVRMFMNSFHYISKMSPSANALIVGDGPEMQKMVDLSKSLNLENKVHFLGYRKDVRRIIATSDILILPALCGLIAFETMAEAKPVITTNNNLKWVCDMIENGVSGFKVKPNPLIIAKTAKKLIDNKNLRKKIGDNARKTVVKKCSWDKIAKTVIEVSENALKK